MAQHLNQMGHGSSRRAMVEGASHTGFAPADHDKQNTQQRVLEAGYVDLLAHELAGMSVEVVLEALGEESST